MSGSPLVLHPSGRRSQELSAIDKKPNWLGFLHVKYVCKVHHIPESLRVPVLQVSPSSTRWRKLRKPYFHVHYKEGQKCLIFEKVVVDSRTRDLAIREACDFMFGVMRRETTLNGSLNTWFENKHGRVEYSVKREEEGD